MMRLFVVFSKKNLAAIFTVLLLIIFLGGELYAAGNIKQDGIDEAARQEYILNLGYQIDGNAEVRDAYIPNEFSDVYENYNVLQRKAGFDLSLYCGKNIQVYTYKVANEDSSQMYINLMVYKGRIIGGDISSVELGGEMRPLLKIA